MTTKQTIDITPRWAELLPAMLQLHRQYNKKRKPTLEDAKWYETLLAEFKTMAFAADKWNAHEKLNTGEVKTDHYNTLVKITGGSYDSIGRYFYAHIDQLNRAWINIPAGVYDANKFEIVAGQ
jgi:hypothetical protein